MTLGYNNNAPRPKREANRNEAIFTFLIVCGIVGLAFSSFTLNNNGKSAPDSPKTIHSSVSPNLSAESSSTTSQTAPILPQVRLFALKDTLEVNLGATFFLENCSPEVEYLLEFENGTRKPFVNGTLQHKFNREGSTSVQLYATYKGEQKKLQSQRFWVARAVEVPHDLLDLMQ